MVENFKRKSDLCVCHVRTRLIKNCTAKVTVLWHNLLRLWEEEVENTENTHSEKQPDDARYTNRKPVVCMKVGCYTVCTCAHVCAHVSVWCVCTRVNPHSPSRKQLSTH